MNNNTKTDNIPINKKKEIRINTISNNSLDKRNISKINSIDENRELTSNSKKKRPNLNMSCINNYNNSIENSNEDDEIQKSEKPTDKKSDILKPKFVYKKHKVNSIKAQQIGTKDLNNEELLNELKEKIEELKKDNQNKEQELNNYKDILKEKDENIQNMENKLEELSKKNEELSKEKNKLLSKLEINKKDIINKEKEINQLKVKNKNEKEKYEKLKSKTEEKFDELKINLE